MLSTERVEHGISTSICNPTCLVILKANEHIYPIFCKGQPRGFEYLVMLNEVNAEQMSYQQAHVPL